MNNFQQQLAFGKVAETHIATWLRRVRGYDILPVYEQEMETGKGPRLFTIDDEIVAPDMLALRDEHIMWIEAKHKSVFSWHSITQRWVTGIDLRHYGDYQRIAQRYPWPVWILFLHRSSHTDQKDLRWGAPPICPTGLFGGSLPYLSQRESHRSDKWGRSGMVYWAHETITRLATIEEVNTVCGSE